MKNLNILQLNFLYLYSFLNITGKSQFDIEIKNINKNNAINLLHEVLFLFNIIKNKDSLCFDITIEKLLDTPDIELSSNSKELYSQVIYLRKIKKILNVAINTIDEISFIENFEMLEKDIEEICYALRFVCSENLNKTAPNLSQKKKSAKSMFFD